MKAIAAVLLALVLGVAAGVASAYVAVDRFALSGEVRVGGWRGNLYTGSSSADPYTRAAIAKTAILALARSETVYFFRAEDDAGQPLDPACTYAIKGRADLPARWWSITLYDESFYLARNQDEAHSIDATRLVRGADGGFNATVGPQRSDAANWLSTNGAKGFGLTLRLYNPPAAVQADPASLTLPTVTRVSCPAKGAP